MVLTVLGAVFLGVASAFLVKRDNGDESGIRGRVTVGCLGEGCQQTPAVGLQEVRRWRAGVKVGHEFPLVK